MNNEELQQELNLQFPSEIAGIKRPTEPVESKHDFFLKMPQLISKDPVLYNKMNLLFSILLSNDNTLKQNIDIILGKLDDDYAQLDSPEFSGIPTVPTPEKQDNSKKITNTEWVQMCINYYINNLKLKKILDMFLDFKKIYDVLITPLGIVVVKNTICIEDKMFNKKINKNKLILTVKEG